MHLLSLTLLEVHIFMGCIPRGFKRGVFSNEVGLGSSVMVHSNSNIKEPVKQDMWDIFAVFAVTMVVRTMTVLVVLTAGGLDGSAFNVIIGEIADGYSDASSQVAF